MMTNREVFQRIMHHQMPDRTPFYLVEGMSDQTERVWYKNENLPVYATGLSAVDYDYRIFTLFKNDHAPYPSCRPKVIKDDGRYIWERDQYGNITKGLSGYHLTPSTKVYVDFPLKTMADWQEYKKRFDPYDNRRLPDYWGQEMFDDYNNGGDPVILHMTWGPARGIKTFFQFGLDRFIDILLYEPEIIEDMFDFWADYTIAFIGRFAEKIKTDAFVLNDDGIAYKTSLMISPDLFAKYYKPAMRRINDYLDSIGIDVRGYYTSGHLDPLIPTLLDTGFNLIGPIETSSAMDAVMLKKEYGRDLLLMGNLSRDAVIEGKEAIKKEVMSKVPWLMEQGGYIPAMDDIITPDIKLENMRYLSQLVRSIKP